MIELKNLRKTFNRNSSYEVVALDGLNLSVETGEFVAIIGSNGAGKTTLLNAIAGLVNLDEGHIIIDSTEVTNVPSYKRARYIGRVFQDPLVGTSASLTVEENLALARLRSDVYSLRSSLSQRARAEFTDELGKLGMGLENRLRERVDSLSGGQRQALAILMATLTRPKVLLLDEHVAALDPRASSEIMRLTTTLIQKHGLTTLMVTHSVSGALEYGDRLVVMHRGRIVSAFEGVEKRKLTAESLLGFYSDLPV